MMIRIDSFPFFVISKDQFDTKRINAYGTEWHINIQLYKYCQTSKEFIQVTSSPSDQPETLATFVCGKRSDRKEFAFDVDATFKFKQPTTAQENRLSHKFCFNSTKQYESWGYRNFAKTDVILTL